MKRIIPPHIVATFGSAREFKKMKRDQLRRVLREIEDLRLGCAYLPCGTRPIMAAREALEQVRIAISEKNWGR